MCPALCDSMDCSPSGFSIHGVFQAQILEWVAIASSRGSSAPRHRTQVCCLAGRCLTLWATREALMNKRTQVIFRIRLYRHSHSYKLLIQSLTVLSPKTYLLRFSILSSISSFHPILLFLLPVFSSRLFSLIAFIACPPALCICVSSGAQSLCLLNIKGTPDFSRLSPQVSEQKYKSCCVYLRAHTWEAVPQKAKWQLC